jgi:hypothetical protein
MTIAAFIHDNYEPRSHRPSDWSGRYLEAAQFGEHVLVPARWGLNFLASVDWLLFSIDATRFWILTDVSRCSQWFRQTAEANCFVLLLHFLAATFLFQLLSA